MDRYMRCYLELLVPEMEEQGIRFRSYNELDGLLKEKADDYFEKQIYPIITPLAVDEAHPFPFISNKSRSLAIKLTRVGTRELFFARIKIPSNRRSEERRVGKE